jgi:hypothetical protein
MLSPRKLAAAHAAYYVVTGAWAVVDRSSFERVTGPKHDYWLVRLVGGLAVAVGASLGSAVVSGRRRQDDTTLALATSIAFVVADGYAPASSVSPTGCPSPETIRMFLPSSFADRTEWDGDPALMNMPSGTASPAASAIAYPRNGLTRELRPAKSTIGACVATMTPRLDLGTHPWRSLMPPEPDIACRC